MTWSLGALPPFIGSRVASCVAILVRVCHQMTNLCKLKIKRRRLLTVLTVLTVSCPPALSPPLSAGSGSSCGVPSFIFLSAIRHCRRQVPAVTLSSYTIGGANSVEVAAE